MQTLVLLSDIHNYRICVICITPTHSLVVDKGITIAAVNFDNLTHNSVSGKRKKVRECVYSNYRTTSLSVQGGFLLTPQSVLCTVTCEDGRTFKLRRLVENLIAENLSTYMYLSPPDNRAALMMYLMYTPVCREISWYSHVVRVMS